MICLGTDAATARATRIDFAETILTVNPGGPAESGWLAPGFIDLQVNGFAGVDFNDPHASIDEIGRALDAILATGVTRCLPTVITGPPGKMLASLGNLHRARNALPRGRAIAG